MSSRLSGSDPARPGGAAIGRLALRLPGSAPGTADDVERDQALTLARLVALRLASSVELPPASAVIDQVRLEVTAGSGENAGTLADRIAALVITRINQHRGTEA